MSYHFKRYQPFLSEGVAKQASTYCDKLLRSQKHSWTTNFAWEDFTKDPERERYHSLNLIHRIKESNPDLHDAIVADIKRHYPTWAPETDGSMQYFVWTGNSRIEWHRDFSLDREGSRCGAITIYLNRQWEMEWGGDFLYKDENNVTQRVTPSYNSAVAIGAVQHRSTRIEGRHFRKCIQIFCRDESLSVDSNKEFC